MIARFSGAVNGKYPGLTADPTILNPGEKARIGCKGLHLKEEKPRITWRVERGAAPNYQMLGRVLAQSGDLYRQHEDGHALIQVLPDGHGPLCTAKYVRDPTVWQYAWTWSAGVLDV